MHYFEDHHSACSYWALEDDTNSTLFSLWVIWLHRLWRDNFFVQYFGKTINVHPCYKWLQKISASPRKRYLIQKVILFSFIVSRFMCITYKCLIIDIFLINFLVFDLFFRVNMRKFILNSWLCVKYPRKAQRSHFKLFESKIR